LGNVGVAEAFAVQLGNLVLPRREFALDEDHGFFRSERMHHPAAAIGDFTVSQRSGRMKCSQRPQRSAMCDDFGV